MQASHSGFIETAHNREHRVEVAKVTTMSGDFDELLDKLRPLVDGLFAAHLGRHPPHLAIE